MEWETLYVHACLQLWPNPRQAQLHHTPSLRRCHTRHAVNESRRGRTPEMSSGAKAGALTAGKNWQELSGATEHGQASNDWSR